MPPSTGITFCGGSSRTRTKWGKAFVVRNFYTHVKTDWVNRDKAVLPDFARPEIPKNVAPIQKLQDAFYAIGTLDASTVFWT